MTIAESAEPLWTENEAWTLAPEPSLVIGGDPADTTQLLHRVRGVERLSVGTPIRMVPYIDFWAKPSGPVAVAPDCRSFLFQVADLIEPPVPAEFRFPYTLYGADGEAVDTVLAYEGTERVGFLAPEFGGRVPIFAPWGEMPVRRCRRSTSFPPSPRRPRSSRTSWSTTRSASGYGSTPGSSEATARASILRPPPTEPCPGGSSTPTDGGWDTSTRS